MAVTTREEALALYDLPLGELAAMADRQRRLDAGDRLDLCTIVNAKCGGCSEDCKWCAQSAHNSTGVEEYGLISVDEMVAAARRAKGIGSKRFGIVTSGGALGQDEVKTVADAIRAIRSQAGIDVCASLGCLTRSQMDLLRQAGLSRYHHNIETSAAYFPKVVSTHVQGERLRTIRDAKESGLSVCSGGIIGMGESRADRVDMALALRDLDVDSVCVNILIPVPGTPLEHQQPVGAVEILKSVAIFRLLLPAKTIKLAAGREKWLCDFQGMAFMAGANGMIIGGYLTQKGRTVEEDWSLIEEIRAAWKQ
jgi:biotin synthase